MEFHVIDSLIPFQWSRLDVTVKGITFEQLMIKLIHIDTGWYKGLLEDTSCN